MTISQDLGSQELGQLLYLWEEKAGELQSLLSMHSGIDKDIPYVVVALATTTTRFHMPIFASRLLGLLALEGSADITHGGKQECKHMPCIYHW